MIRSSVETSSTLATRADLGELGAFDEASLEVDLTISTGADVDRYDYGSGRPFVERLSLDPKHVRLARLNAGASVLDSHSGYSLANVLGALVPGTAKIERGARMSGRVRMSDRAEIAGYVRDIARRIIRFVSVGYKVHAYRSDGVDARGVQILTAIDWEPYEVSFVPVPADFLAQSRAANADAVSRCSVPVLASDGDAILAERSVMDPINPNPAAPAAPAVPVVPAVAPAAPVAETRNAPAMAAPAAPAAPLPATAAEVVTICRAAGLTPEETNAIAARNLPIDAVRAAALNVAIERQAPSDPRPGIAMGEDARDKWARGAEAWLLIKSGAASLIRQAAALPQFAGAVGRDGRPVFAVDPNPGEFRGMTLIDIAREALERGGVKTRGLDRMDLASRAFVHRDAGGIMAVGDFPLLLENVLNKVLLAAYATAPDTWSRWCKRGTVTDFRASNRYRLGSFSVLDPLTQSGEFAQKAINDAEKASISAGTKGNIVGITRQTIVNDDLGGLVDLLSMLGRAAMLTVEVDAYALLAQNAGLGPTFGAVPVFDASRGNIGGAGAMSAARLDADAALMSSQRDPGGNEFLALEPAILLVPRGLKGDALIINGAEFDPDNIASGSKATNRPNVARGLFREVVATPRLTGTRRYLFADPSVAPVFEVVFLEGQDAPVLESKDGWRLDGTEMRVRLDFGVGAIDYRGAVTAAGA